MACSHLSHSLPLHQGARLLVKTGCSGIKQKNPTKAVLFMDVHTIMWEELLLSQEKAENNIQPCTGGTHPGAPLFEAAEGAGKAVLLWLVLDWYALCWETHSEKRAKRTITYGISIKGGSFLFTELWWPKLGLHTKFLFTIKMRLCFGSPSLNKQVKLGCNFQIRATSSKNFIDFCSFLIYIFSCLWLQDVKENRVSLQYHAQIQRNCYPVTAT